MSISGIIDGAGRLGIDIASGEPDDEGVPTGTTPPGPAMGLLIGIGGGALLPDFDDGAPGSGGRGSEPTTGPTSGTLAKGASTPPPLEGGDGAPPAGGDAPRGGGSGRPDTIGPTSGRPSTGEKSPPELDDGGAPAPPADGEFPAPSGGGSGKLDTIGPTSGRPSTGDRSPPPPEDDGAPTGADGDCPAPSGGGRGRDDTIGPTRGSPLTGPRRPPEDDGGAEGAPLAGPPGAPPTGAGAPPGSGGRGRAPTIGPTSGTPFKGANGPEAGGGAPPDVAGDLGFVAGEPLAGAAPPPRGGGRGSDPTMGPTRGTPPRGASRPDAGAAGTAAGDAGDAGNAGPAGASIGRCDPPSLAEVSVGAPCGSAIASLFTTTSRRARIMRRWSAWSWFAAETGINRIRQRTAGRPECFARDETDQARPRTR